MNKMMHWISAQWMVATTVLSTLQWPFKCSFGNRALTKQNRIWKPIYKWDRVELPVRMKVAWGRAQSPLPICFPIAVWTPESVGQGVGTSHLTKWHHYEDVLSRQAGGYPAGLQLALKGFELRNLGPLAWSSNERNTWQHVKWKIYRWWQ